MSDNKKNYDYAHPPAPAGEGKAGKCPWCGATEWFNVYSYLTTDGQGRPLKVYTDAAGDGDRLECAHKWHVEEREIEGIVERTVAKIPGLLAQAHPTPSHDAGGVGEAKAAFYERALKFVAAYKAYADAIGNGLPRKGTDVVWADKEQHAKCIDLLIAYDALLAAEARRGESGEAIDAQGGRE